MKLKAAAAALATAVVSAWLIIPAQSEFPRMKQADGEKEETKGPSKPRKPYLVFPAPQIPANGQPEDILRAASTLEDSLNKSHAGGYRFAGMNDHFIVMEQAPPQPLPSETRRRVVLPTQ